MSGASSFDVQKLFGDSLVLKGAKFDTASLAGKVVAIYFSAHWSVEHGDTREDDDASAATVERERIHRKSCQRGIRTEV